MRHNRTACTTLLAVATLFLLCACTNGRAPVSTGGASSRSESTKNGKYVVGDDIRIEDITEFYFTYDASTNPPEFQRYHFYVEDGAYLFFHETREGDHWPLTEEDTTVSGSKELTEEEWNVFFDYLKGGSVEKREDDAGDGGSGPWLYLYWDGDRSKYQVFTFASYEKQTAFEEYCIKLKESSSGTQDNENGTYAVSFPDGEMEGNWVDEMTGNEIRLYEWRGEFEYVSGATGEMMTGTPLYNGNPEVPEYTLQTEDGNIFAEFYFYEYGTGVRMRVTYHFPSGDFTADHVKAMD